MRREQLVPDRPSPDCLNVDGFDLEASTVGLVTLDELTLDAFGAAKPSWQLHAACRGLDVSLFFPPRGASPSEARKVCAACPVRDPCLVYALEVKPTLDHGVWAGTSVKDRRRIRRDRRLADTG